MSQLPKPRLSYKHGIDRNKHEIRLYDSTGFLFLTGYGQSFEDAFHQTGILLKEYMEHQMSLRRSNMKMPSLREQFKPYKKLDGFFPIREDLWKQMTEIDFINGYIGIITQAELGRIRGVSRQAIHQSVARGDVEIFVWRDEKYIPFDTIAVSPLFYDQIGNPMVIYYSENGKKKKPRRRFKKETL